MSQKIVPSLWYNGNAKQAADFYVEAFSTIGVPAEVTNTAYYPTDGLADFQKPMAGKELVVEFAVGGQQFGAINAGPEFSFTPALSFMLNFDPSRDQDAAAHLDQLWDILSADGNVLMPLGEYPFSSHYGWVADRYGLSWQLMLTNPEGDPRPFILPAFLFTEFQKDKAYAAASLYTSLIPESEFGVVACRSENSDSTMFMDFTLGGQWFTAMDSGIEHGFTFNEAFSLQIYCDGQDEIDRVWLALSTHPESERCGWCKDEFGVSWQVLPRDLGSLMSKPNAYEHLMSMKKIVIADF